MDRARIEAEAIAKRDGRTLASVDPQVRQVYLDWGREITRGKTPAEQNAIRNRMYLDSDKRQGRIDVNAYREKRKQILAQEHSARLGVLGQTPLGQRIGQAQVQQGEQLAKTQERAPALAKFFPTQQQQVQQRREFEAKSEDFQKRALEHRLKTQKKEASEVSPEIWNTALRLAREAGYKGDFTKLPKEVQADFKGKAHMLAKEEGGLYPEDLSGLRMNVYVIAEELGKKKFPLHFQQGGGLENLPTRVRADLIEKASLEAVQPFIEEAKKAHSQQKVQHWLDVAEGIKQDYINPVADPLAKAVMPPVAMALPQRKQAGDVMQGITRAVLGSPVDVTRKIAVAADPEIEPEARVESGIGAAAEIGAEVLPFLKGGKVLSKTDEVLDATKVVDDIVKPPVIAEATEQIATKTAKTAKATQNSQKAVKGVSETKPKTETPQQGAQAAKKADSEVGTKPTETPTTPDARRVKVGDKEYELSGEARSAYEKAEAEYKAKLATADEKSKKALAEQWAAQRRAIVGARTAKEAEAATKQAQKITAGTEVTDGTRTGKALGNPAFGKVKVQWEDGVEETVEWAAIKPAKQADTGPLKGVAPVTKPVGQAAVKTEAKAETQAATQSAKVSSEPTFKPTHAETEKLRSELGLPERTKDGRTWDQAAKKAADDGTIADARRIAEDVVKNKRTLNDGETIALAFHTRGLKARRSSLIDGIEEATKNGDKDSARFLREQLTGVEQDLEVALDAVDLTGSEAGRSLNARKIFLADQYDDLTIKRRAEALKQDGPLTEAEIARARYYGKRVEELEKQVEAAERLAVKGEVHKAFGQARIRAAKSGELNKLVTQEAYQEAAKNLLAVPAGAGIPLDKFTSLAKMALYHLERGARTVDEVFKALRGVVPKSISDEDLYEAIRAGASQYGRKLNRGRSLDEQLLVEGRYGIQDKNVAKLRAELDAIKTDADDFVSSFRKPTVSEQIGDVSNIFRALQATGDFSSVGRQSAVLLFGHPVRSVQSIVEGLKALSPKHARVVESMLRARPLYVEGKKAGLYLAPLNGRLAQREEAFFSKWLSKVPVVGQIRDASERLYVTQLNTLRASLFDDFVRRHPSADAKTLHDWADFINKATGRGDLSFGVKSLEGMNQAAPFWANVFFSPRFAASRFQIASPMKIWKASPTARKAILKDLVAYAATVSAIWKLAEANGAKVELDPTHSDFGKIEINGIQYDVTGGMLPQLRLLARIWKQEIRYDQGGTTVKRDTDIFNLGASYAKTKLSPQAGLAAEGLSMLSKKTKPGHVQPIFGEQKKLTAAAVERLYPIWIQNVKEAAEQEGKGEAVKVGVSEFFGISANPKHGKD